jgi:hypothetical protein
MIDCAGFETIASSPFTVDISSDNIGVLAMRANLPQILIFLHSLKERHYIQFLSDLMDPDRPESIGIPEVIMTIRRRKCSFMTHLNHQTCNSTGDRRVLWANLWVSPRLPGAAIGKEAPLDLPPI